MEKKRYLKVDTVRGFLFALTLLEAPVFFSVYALFGQTYEGSESSMLYVVYMVLLLLIQVFFLLRNRRVKVAEFRWLLAPLFFVLLVWVTARLYHSRLSVSTVRNSILWQYTGILLAINIHAFKKYEPIISSLVALMLLITAGAIANILVPVIRGLVFYAKAGYSLSGNSLQSQSYYIAVAAGINLFFFAFRKRTGSRQAAVFVILGVQLVCAIFAGGRGAMVLALLYCLVYFLYSNRDAADRKRKIQRMVIYLFLFVVLSLFLWQLVGKNQLMQQRLGRVFSYIGESGIDMTQTSNRDVLYLNALARVRESPVYGHGIASYLYLSGLYKYPHNIFLEMLLEGGVIYMLLWIAVVVRGYRRIRRAGNDHAYRVYLITALYALTKLMFSGTYSSDMSFWFSVVFAYVASREVALE